jgi:hypothetical protein
LCFSNPPAAASVICFIVSTLRVQAMTLIIYDKDILYKLFSVSLNLILL